ncbi:MAG: hypothetical protein OEW00_14535, partial [candidate division Zixibacteria bacterium]|nr:hypothetical protein [candidate division Zixibacteria bacterium]
LILLMADLVWPVLGLFAGSLLSVLLDSILFLLRLFGRELAPVLETTHLSAVLVVMTYILIVAAVWALQSRPVRRAAVIWAAVLLNVGLLLGVVNTFSTTYDKEIFVFKVPGGIGTMLSDPAAGSHDLVICGLRAGDYQVDDVILNPVLQYCGVDRLHYLFLLNADYGAIDDILRLAEARRADCIYVSPFLTHSLADALNQRSNLEAPFEIAPLTGSFAASYAPGYFPVDRGLLTDLGDCQLLIAADIDSKAIWDKGLTKPRVVVVGGQLKLTDDRLAAPAGIHLSQLVCAGVAGQPTGGYESRIIGSEEVPRGEIWDLNCLGNLKLGVIGDQIYPVFFGLD